MKRAVAAILAIAAIPILPSPPEARADILGDEDACVSQFWMWRGLRGSTRLICDSPRNADGSWRRARGFFANGYYQPITCSRYTCTGGYWVPELKVIDHYPVTDATVLHDEPEHINPS